ncbi:MAG TPA: hypothetical protein ENN03_02800 [bacterium]|nr:hypothetical protein [bacterium]
MRYQRPAAVLIWCLTTGVLFGEGLGIRLQADRIRSVSGSRDESTAMADYVDPGMSGGFAVTHRISPGFGIEAGVELGWMTVSKDMKPDPSKDPAFVLPRVKVSNLVYFSAGRVSPYLRLGFHVTGWRFTEDGPDGKVAEFEGEKIQKMSFGLHGGLGVEMKLLDRLSLFGEAGISVLFCRDTFFFGKGFTEQGILALGGGIVFYPFH